jgi:hypothetical protein
MTTGNIHFSMKALMHNTGGVADALAGVYGERALVPASPWLGEGKAAKPQAAFDGKELRIDSMVSARWFVIRTRTGEKWETIFRPADKPLSLKLAADEIHVSAVDRMGNEGEAIRLTATR